MSNVGLLSRSQWRRSRSIHFYSPNTYSSELICIVLLVTPSQDFLFEKKALTQHICRPRKSNGDIIFIHNNENRRSLPCPVFQDPPTLFSLDVLYWITAYISFHAQFNRQHFDTKNTSIEVKLSG